MALLKQPKHISRLSQFFSFPVTANIEFKISCENVVFADTIYHNKTKVLRVQLGKTLCLSKVPITEIEESTQVRKLGLTERGMEGRKEGRKLGLSKVDNMTVIFPECL